VHEGRAEAMGAGKGGLIDSFRGSSYEEPPLFRNAEPKGPSDVFRNH
jgi:hypothetical protein